MTVLERLDRLDERVLGTRRRTRLQRFELLTAWSSGAMLAFAWSQRWVRVAVFAAVALTAAFLGKRQERRSAAT